MRNMCDLKLLCGKRDLKIHELTKLVIPLDSGMSRTPHSKRSSDLDQCGTVSQASQGFPLHSSLCIRLALRDLY